MTATEERRLVADLHATRARAEQAEDLCRRAAAVMRMYGHMTGVRAWDWLERYREAGL